MPENGPKPPVETIELRLDPLADAAVRALWDLLTEADVSSMGRSGTNAPHVTLAAIAHTDGGVARACEELADIAQGLIGMPLTLSGLGLFPHRTTVLYASVVVRQQLLTAHAAVHAVLAAHGIAPYGTTLPDRWTPHCTLAKRLRREQLSVGLGPLVEHEFPIEATVARVTHWDGGSRETTVLAGG